MASPFLILTVIFFALIFSAPIFSAPLRAEESETAGNWCRHVCILSRWITGTTASTDCFIPVDKAKIHSITLRKTIEQEWQWVLDYPETNNGQVFVVDKDTVTFLSQKVCLDAGNSTAHPVRPLFENVGNKAVRIGLAGDFHLSPARGDNIFKSCVNNPTTWPDFTFKRSLRDKGTPMAPTSGQYLEVHVGGHEGLGTKLLPFDFSYTDADLERTFKAALKNSAAREAHHGVPVNDTVQTGQPVLLHKLPFETGHALLATNVTAGIYQDLHHDITKTAWNRLLKAVPSLTLSGKPAPPVLLPDKLPDHDMLELIVLAVVAIVSLRQTVSSVASSRRSHVKHWEPPRGSRQIKHWAKIKNSADQAHLSRYQAPDSAWELSGLSVAFAIAITAIVVALLQFRDTDWRYNKFIIVRQGGLITYGPSNSTTWSYDLTNEFAGAIFVVGHWYVAQITKVGKPGRFAAIVAMYGVLILALCFIVYRFGTLREHKLDNWVVRWVVGIFRVIPQAVIGGFLRLTPDGRGFQVISWFCSFRSTYLNLAHHFAKENDLKEISSRMTFSQWFDGALIPCPHVESTSQADELSGLENNAEKIVSVHASVDFEEEGFVQLTEDEVRKAAAFLAADQFGRLTYPQVIALLSYTSLLNAAESLRNFGDTPKPTELRGFAQLYHVQAILFPERSETSGVIKDDGFSILDPKKEFISIDPQNYVMLLAYRNEDPNQEAKRFGVLLNDDGENEVEEEEEEM